MSSPASVYKNTPNNAVCPRAAPWIVCLGASLHAAALTSIAVALSNDVSIITQSRFVIFLALMTAWCAIEALSHEPRPCSCRLDASRAVCHPATIGIALLASTIASISQYALHHETLAELDALPTLAGAAMMIVGIALRYTAIRTLAHFFLDHITLLDEHRRINTGIYAHLKHPSELGTLSLATGIAAMLGSTVGVAIVLLILLPLVLARMHSENTLMATVPA